MELINKIRSSKIYFGLPAYDSTVNVIFMDSMLKTVKMLDKYGVESNLAILNGDCYVQRARNEIAASFLKTGYTHLFFVDSDMGWRPEDVLRLLARDKELIVGAYHLKTDTGKQKYLIEPFSENGKMVSENGLIKVRSAATGFMCIKRIVFEKMIQHYPDIMYQGTDDDPYWAFFHCSLRKMNGHNKNIWFGEDIDFCHKWVAMGGDIWCEPNTTIRHAGQKVWECNLSEQMEKKGYEL